MSHLSSGTLRLRAGADTLMIGHRADFGHGRGICRLESEDEVRRRLIQAMSDPGSLESLRQFWARHQFDTRQITHTSHRILIDRVARATVRGPLSAYVVPDASVQHMIGAASAIVVTARQVEASAPVARSGATKTSTATNAAAPAPGIDTAFNLETSSEVGEVRPTQGNQQSAGPLQVALMPLEARIVEVLRRAPRRMPASLRESSRKLFEPAALAATAQVLSAWAAMHTISPGFLIEAVLLADGQVPTSFVAMEAAEKFDEAFALARTARDERQFDEAAVRLAEAIALIGLRAFLAVVWRGANRYTSVNKSRGLR